MKDAKDVAHLGCVLNDVCKQGSIITTWSSAKDIRGKVNLGVNTVCNLL